MTTTTKEELARLDEVAHSPRAIQRIGQALICLDRIFDPHSDLSDLNGDWFDKQSIDTKRNMLAGLPLDHLVDISGLLQRHAQAGGFT